MNPTQVVDLRPPRATEHFAPGTQCLVFTTDGKYMAVMQTCEAVSERLKDYDVPHQK